LFISPIVGSVGWRVGAWVHKMMGWVRGTASLVDPNKCPGISRPRGPLITLTCLL